MSIVATLYPRRRRRKSRHCYVRSRQSSNRSFNNKYGELACLLAWSDAYVLTYLYLSQAPQTEQKWMAAVSYLKPSSCGEKMIKKKELTWKVEALYLYVSSRPSLEEY